MCVHRTSRPADLEAIGGLNPRQDAVLLPSCPEVLKAHYYADAVLGPDSNDFTSFLLTFPHISSAGKLEAGNK